MTPRALRLAAFVGLIMLLPLAHPLIADAPGTPHAGKHYDVVVYGGTSAGVTASVQAATLGKSVLLIEPGRHIGGLTSGGLGATDIGNKQAIGGLSREFYRRIRNHYAGQDAWKHEAADDYRSRRQRGDEQEMWTFEPRVAEAVLRQMLDEAGVQLVQEERLKLDGGVHKQGLRIVRIEMESGLSTVGTMYIDATYEGDLMAKAGVAYHVGRESTETYDESYNGVQTRSAIYHQFIVPVDPYVVKGDPSSGLLPGVSADGPGPEGSGDHRVQAYCFRMCTTDVAENSVPWQKPADYNPLRYELLLRNFDAGDRRIPWSPTLMPNRKTDTNNNYAVSTDHLGQNYDYPDAGYQRRQEILEDHLSYQQGLMWTLANHPRVPAEVRREFQTWRPARDEFVDSDHWPHQLYVREARRMISDYVMTEHDCFGYRQAPDPVGLAAYTMDSHHVQRYVVDGRVLNEGDVQVGGFTPFPISYRSIRPNSGACSNLLVPVCLSASHIAYGSIRMEPVFMVLGQSAATAACIAIDAGADVQDVDYATLRKRLLADGQILDWTGPRRLPPLQPDKLPGIVVDDQDAEFTGSWTPSKSVGRYVGFAYLHDGNANKGELRAVFRPHLSESGRYEVRLAYTAASNRATNVPVTIVTDQGTETRSVDQRKSPGANGFLSLGTFRFAAGTAGYVVVSNGNTDGHVVVDAVQFLPAAAP